MPFFSTICRSARVSSAFVVLALCLSPLSLHAQARPLITTAIDDTQLAPLAGSSMVLGKAAVDKGVVSGSAASGRLLLLLKRPVEQETALQQYLQQVHDPTSPQFHQWLKAGEFGARFGAADSDIAQATAWLQSHGLNITSVSAGKQSIAFGGTIAQVNEAFHTSIHQYSVQGVTHYANAVAPQIPLALSSLVAGVSQLNDLHAKAQNKLLGEALYDAKKHTGVPQWTYPEGAGFLPFYFLAPEDFATQYDVQPVYSAGINGAGQTIGIINDSNIDLSLVNAYRKLFGLSVNTPQVVVDGNDPGINGDSIEAYLDVENAGAVAPGATIKLYIAGQEGLLGDGGIGFSMLRAVNDDVASVLSLSFGNCEENGTAYNQYINGVWEQAAAQGQTVLVSAGDSGSLGCYGLGVNGLASTPWDIGVGGTDAYFVDYATGAASISTYWSNSNDASLGSLQQKMLEQPWDGTQFGLNSINYDPIADQPDNGGAGGGGSSACAVGPGTFDPNTGLPICTSGYPKPAWQVGAGVPANGVRNLPDVALFASNGYNGVTWPVCAEPGDCTTTDPTVGSVYVTGVGGTSASAPAMAGVMALVNQKYGPQGQANVVLYPLAAQYPATFNDITVGSNNEPCASYNVGFEIGCSLDTSDSYYSLHNYSAGVGYDRASGLGSVDVNQLLTNWTKVAFKSSSTTLTLNPTTIVHGQNVTANVAVTGTSPTGDVALVSTTPLPNNKGITAIELGANGTGTEIVGYLPGGTYTVSGRYGGDGINAPSVSQPVSVTVTPESSTLLFTPQYLDVNTFNPAPIKANSQVPYGDQTVIDVQVANAAGVVNGLPTGSVTFTDGTTTLATVQVSAGGTAEFNASFLAVGTHVLSASYSGDASYKSSTTASITFSVVQTSTDLFSFADNGAGSTSTGAYQYQAGQPAEIEVIISPNAPLDGLAPTGTVVYQLGNNAPVTVPVSPNQNLSIFGSVSVAPIFISSLKAGTYSLTETYSGDANFLGSTNIDTIVVVAPTLLNTVSSFTVISPANPANIQPGQPITIVGTITGAGTVAPTGTASFTFANVFSFAPVTITPGPANISTVEITFRPAQTLPGNNVVTMFYSGDSVYAPSTSASSILVDNVADFTMEALTPNVAVAGGASGTSTIAYGALSGFSGSIGETCVAPTGITCSLSTASVSLTGATASSIVTINAFTTSATLRSVPGLPGNGLPGKTTGVVLACFMLCALPFTKRRGFGKLLVLLVGITVVSTMVGCSKDAPVTATAPTGPTITKKAPGSYAVVVTATAASGVVHNAVITVVVQ